MYLLFRIPSIWVVFFYLLHWNIFWFFCYFYLFIRRFSLPVLLPTVRRREDINAQAHMVQHVLELFGSFAKYSIQIVRRFFSIYFILFLRFGRCSLVVCYLFCVCVLLSCTANESIFSFYFRIAKIDQLVIIMENACTISLLLFAD